MSSRNHHISLTEVSKIKKIYQEQFKQVSNLNNQQLQKLHNKLDLISTDTNNTYLKQILESVITSEDFYYPQDKDWKKLGQLSPKVFSDISQVFSNYQIIKDNQILFGMPVPNYYPQFLLKKKDQLYFIKKIQLPDFYLNKIYFDDFVEGTQILYQGSDLDLTFKIEEKLICQIKNTKYLIIIYQYQEGTILYEWLKNHTLPANAYQKINQLLQKGIKHNIITGQINTYNLVILKNQKSQPFKLLDLGFDCQYISSMVDQKVKQLKSAISFYQDKSYLNKLIIDKIIKEKIITLD